MPASDTELRAHRRVEFFRVPAEHHHLPVWVFMPTGTDDALAGLVLNFSDGGVQVLTNADEPLDGASYELQLLLGEDDAVPRFRAEVSRV
ncbi:MAG: PilZ domain-containing protein, partial [Betaproteobacteria bacterium]